MMAEEVGIENELMERKRDVQSRLSAVNSAIKKYVDEITAATTVRSIDGSSSKCSEWNNCLIPKNPNTLPFSSREQVYGVETKASTNSDEQFRCMDAKIRYLQMELNTKETRIRELINSSSQTVCEVQKLKTEIGELDCQFKNLTSKKEKLTFLVKNSDANKEDNNDILVRLLKAAKDEIEYIDNRNEYMMDQSAFLENERKETAKRVAETSSQIAKQNSDIWSLLDSLRQIKIRISQVNEDIRTLTYTTERIHRYIHY